MGGIKNPNLIRVCKICGRKYHPNSSRQQCCNLPTDKTCPICGKVYQVLCKPKLTQQTCSKKCSDELIIRNRIASAAKLIKVCKACGKPFTPKSARDVYCQEKHYRNCDVCGKEYEYDPRCRNLVKTCSTECRYVLASNSRDIEASMKSLRKSLIEKYGVENASQIPGVMDKVKRTNLKKYGVEWFTQTPEYLEKTKETALRKYGAEHHMSSPEFIQKRIDKLKSDQGVENVFQLEEIKEKSKQTIKDRYGYEYISQVPEIQEKVKNTNFKRYGVKHAMLLEEFKEKARETSRKLYGRDYKKQMCIQDIDNWYAFIRDPRTYISGHYAGYPRSEELAKDLGVDVSTVDEYLKRPNAQDCISKARSLMENELVDFIRSLDSDIKIIHNDKTQIRPHELDLYMPDYKFAIECNPTCTHNSSFCDPWGGTPKNRKYHQQKTEECDEKGIFLFHIFGYEWEYNKDIILSMITNILGKNPIKIYARNCDIREVSYKDARKFLNENHRQGNTNSQIRLGLYEDDRLVSIMTFGKFRSTLGTGNEDLSDCWELSRFCSLKYTTVIGGAEKLFKYFVNKFKSTRIRSFSDRSHTRGTIYTTLGFHEIRRSEPNYVWVDIKTDKGYHRANAQKKNLHRFLKDPSIDLSKTEVKIMNEHKFAQVFDSGTITWEWNKA